MIGSHDPGLRSQTPRTFVFGDIHGEMEHLQTAWSKLPGLGSSDTLVFLGDYLDRGPCSREVVDWLMNLPQCTPAKVICLRGNHEDAWLQVRAEGWDGFVLPPEHGCLATLRSYEGGKAPEAGETASMSEMGRLCDGSFLPENVVEWLKGLPFWYEDAQGIYVHAGLPRGTQGFAHPSEVANPRVLAWRRTDDFVRNYRGKDVFFGHTPTTLLPQELSLHTPDDSADAYMTEDCCGLDTGCGIGGFLTVLELPGRVLYESSRTAV